MVPKKVSLVRRLFGKEGSLVKKARPAILSQSVPHYGHLGGLFFNMSDTERTFLASNFYQLDDGLKEYLIHKGAIQDKSAKPAVVEDADGNARQEEP